MANKNRDWFLDEWFYQVMLILLGFMLLSVKLGYINEAYLGYWPLLLIATALKEILDRN